ncbi:MAG: hypothetical protein J3K34DRAFT_430846 [Monoraphidium minutum]|nr:MAG: hypothetical protein J3K34DRAFT_430846 [Monoraphidium minutum]
MFEGGVTKRQGRNTRGPAPGPGGRRARGPAHNGASPKLSSLDCHTAAQPRGRGRAAARRRGAGARGRGRQAPLGATAAQNTQTRLTQHSCLGVRTPRGAGGGGRRRPARVGARRRPPAGSTGGPRCPLGVRLQPAARVGGMRCARAGRTLEHVGSQILRVLRSPLWYSRRGGGRFLLTHTQTAAPGEAACGGRAQAARARGPARAPAGRAAAAPRAPHARAGQGGRRAARVTPEQFLVFNSRRGRHRAQKQNSSGGTGAAKSHAPGRPI